MGPGEQELKLVSRFDRDADQRLNAEERQAARAFLQQDRATRRQRPGPGPGPRGPFRGGPNGQANVTPPQPGPQISPDQVARFTNAPLYDACTLRTLFLRFDQADWEKELADFKNTDVEVPVELSVDGKVYSDVGVHFRGASSFMMVGEGYKRSLNLSLDFVHKDQRLLGYRTLNLLNSHDDPTFLRTILYSQIAQGYLPTPQANLVRVVINGESWGIYVNVQQFNKDFTKEYFNSTQGTRWKVPGRPNGDAGLTWLGSDPAEYKRRYEIKSKDDDASWNRLIELCRVLEQTPARQLESALKPLLDVDSTLKFLALENALINNDGYWIRASDYHLYLDVQGRFHPVAHDINETFSRPGGPGGPGGPGMRFVRRAEPPRADDGPPPFPPFGPVPVDHPGADGAGAGPGRGPALSQSKGPIPFGAPPVQGVELDPLVAATNSSRPLLAKLLAVPELRARYLTYIRDIATKALDWKTLGPLAKRYQSLIEADVKLDTRKLESYDAFIQGIDGARSTTANSSQPSGPHGPPSISLKDFADQRRTYLLEHATMRTISNSVARSAEATASTR
jgi:hypothetical protein